MTCEVSAVTLTPIQEADVLRRVLLEEKGYEPLHLSRQTAEFLVEVLEARAHGRQVVVTRTSAEVTPNEAAELLGMSRPQVRKLMERGDLEFRKVGTHHRISLASAEAFLVAERLRRGTAMAELSQVQNDLDLTE